MYIVLANFPFPSHSTSPFTCWFADFGLVDSEKGKVKLELKLKAVLKLELELGVLKGCVYITRCGIHSSFVDIAWLI